MRVRASLVVSLIAALVTTTPADAAAPRISVDNVDSLRVVDTYDLGAARAYRSAIDRDDLYLTEYVGTGDMAHILRVALDSGRIRWSIDVSCTIGGPELGGNIVLFAARPCAVNPRPQVTAVRAATGRTAWTAVADGAVRAGPAVILWRVREFGDGRTSVHLWAVHPTTGRDLWTYRSPGDVSEFLFARVVRDAVYLDDAGDVVAIDPRTGAVRWRRTEPPDGSQGLWNADPTGPYVYRRHGDISFLTALDPDTGAVRWRVAQPTGGFFDDGVAYVSLQTPTAGPTGVYDLEARSMADGSLLWTGLSMPQLFESSGGVLYGTRFDFSQPALLRLVALDAATGSELAEYPTNYDSVVTPERYLMHAGEGVFEVYEPTR